MDILRKIEDEQLKKDLPDFRVGDTVRVDYRVVEGTRERIQAYEGTIIKIQGHGSKKTFTVRRLSYGVGVERDFPIHSTRIAKITVLRRGRVRRARLFYLRDRQGKAAKVREKQSY